MSKGRMLMLSGRYREAIPELEKELPRDQKTDSFQWGVRLSIAICHLCLGRTEMARAQIDEMAAETGAGYTISPHFIYRGTAYWFDGNHAEAIAEWKRSLKSGYAWYKGTDVRLLLWYAAVREPDLVASSEIRELLQKQIAKLHPASISTYLVRFALDDFDEDELRSLEEALWDKCTSANKKYNMMIDGILIAFYSGVKCLERGDREGFLDRMLRCATLSGHEYRTHEIFLARHELEQAGRGRKVWYDEKPKAKRAAAGLKSAKGKKAAKSVKKSVAKKSAKSDRSAKSPSSAQPSEASPKSLRASKKIRKRT